MGVPAWRRLGGTTEELNVGTEVLLEGRVEIDQDFGSGYRYRVLLADARRVQP